MHQAARRIQRPGPVGPQGRTLLAESRPPIDGMPRGQRAPMAPPKRQDPREALRAATDPASTRRREPYLIAGLVAAGVVALVLHSTGVDGLPFRSPAPAQAREGLAVTAANPAREARELRELSQLGAAAAAERAEKTAQATERGSASSPNSDRADESSESGSSGPTARDDDGSTTLLDDSTTLLEDPTAALDGTTSSLEDSANQLLEDSTTLLQDTTKQLENTTNAVLEASESLELDPTLP